MEKEDTQSSVFAIASLTLEAIQRLSREGKNLGSKELAAILSTSNDLKDLMKPASGADVFHKKEMLRLKKELQSLKGHFGKVDTKRRELANQLDALEALNSQYKAFVQRAIPTLAQLARSGGNSQLHSHLERLTSLLKTDAPVEQLEETFQSFKDLAFQEELKKADRSPSSTKTSSLFNLFKRRTDTAGVDPVSHFRDTYLDIVEELRLNLDQAALDELAEIKTLLSGDLQLDDFLPIRGKILQLLKNFISRISSERKHAASFIYEVEKRLSEVEGQMFRSIAASQESRYASVRLTDTIEKEIDAFQETVDFSKSLEDLKSRIMERIGAIKTVIESGRKEDLLRNSKTDKMVAALKKNLERMKGEIKSAKKRSEILETELLTDPLTLVFNRRAYDRRISDELKRYQRYRNAFSMLLLDVDYFKDINDRYGHAVGDLCLKELINRIKPLLRDTDFLARYGGEEFIIILPETTNEGAAIAAEKIRTHIEKTEFLHKGEQVKVTISLGGTQVREADKTEAQIFERVDNAMYRAKQSGRNTVVML